MTYTVFGGTLNLTQLNFEVIARGSSVSKIAIALHLCGMHCSLDHYYIKAYYCILSNETSELIYVFDS